METERSTRKRLTEEQCKTFASEVKQGSSLKQALVKAGVSPAQAKKGKRAITGPLRKALIAELGADYETVMQFGRTIDPLQMRHAVLGGLARGIAQGSDKGAQILKLAGGLRELNMYTPDSQVGVIVLGNLPKIDQDLLPPGVALDDVKE